MRKMSSGEKLKNGKREKYALRTLIGGFILHIIIGTFHTWPRIARYLYSYLAEINDASSLPQNYLYIIYGTANVPHGIFMFIGVLFSGYISTIKITGIGLLFLFLSHSMLIFLPDIKYIIISIYITSSATGFMYLPIITEIWKYYPNSKGFCTSFVLSGFGVTRLLFKYLSLYFINPENILTYQGTEKYPPLINNLFKSFLKKYTVLFCILSFLTIILIYPYDLYVKNEKTEIEEEIRLEIEKEIEKNIVLSKTAAHRSQSVDITNQVNQKKLLEMIIENEINNDDDNIGFIKNFVEKIKCNKNDNDKSYEPMSFLLTSFPFIQLTLIFFLTNIFGIVEFSTLRKFGNLYKHTDNFLWYTNFITKAINAACFILWGYLLDKIKFKKLYTIVLSTQITISSIIYFIVPYRLGFVVSSFVTAFINSVNPSINVTTFEFMFGIEKGILLYSISSILTNTFYIARPFIGNIFTAKMFFLMFYLSCSFLSMLALIILCFFVEKKHVYKAEIEKDEDEREIEMEDKQSDKSDNDD